MNWDFGDESNSGDRNPVHEFTTLGIYTVNLTATNENGTASKLATITVSEKPVPVLPVANFSTNTTTGSAPLSVQFNDLSLEATGRIWNFGDGVTSTDANPSHTYATAGTFTANLNVSNTNGTDSVSKIITVTGKPIRGFPKAIFTATPLAGHAPLTVKFTDKSTNAASIKWDFGDKSAISTESKPSHTYKSAGTYLVKLTAINGKKSDVTTKKVIVSTKKVIFPKAIFTATPLAGRAPLTVKFTDKSTNADSIKWDFGDKSAISTESKPSHTYKSAGTYLVKLTAINGEKSDVVTKKVIVSKRWR